jgi:hypothetical protein
VTRLVARTAAGATAVLLLVGLLNGTQYLDARRYNFAQAPPSYHLPSGKFLRAASFGFNEAIADLLWLSTVVYFTSEYYGRLDYRYLERYLDTVIALDPHLRGAYKYGAVLPIFNKRRITYQSIMTAIRYAERGSRAFPDDYEFPFKVGALYFLEMNSILPSRRKEWRKRGAFWIQKAAALPGAPHWLPLLAANLFTQAGDAELAVRHLEEMYLAAEDPEMKQQLGFKLRDLRQEQARLLFDERARFEERWRASFPYVPGDFFVLVGDRIEPYAGVASLLSQEPIPPAPAAETERPAAARTGPDASAADAGAADAAAADAAAAEAGAAEAGAAEAGAADTAAADAAAADGISP